MYLPNGIDDLSPNAVRDILERFSEHTKPTFVTLESHLAEVASRLKRSGYLSASLEHTARTPAGKRVDTFRSRGLTPNGKALLRLFEIEPW